MRPVAPLRHQPVFITLLADSRIDVDALSRSADSATPPPKASRVHLLSLWSAQHIAGSTPSPALGCTKTPTKGRKSETRNDVLIGETRRSE